jgi:hypothetical protein
MVSCHSLTVVTSWRRCAGILALMARDLARHVGARPLMRQLLRDIIRGNAIAIDWVAIVVKCARRADSRSAMLVSSEKSPSPWIISQFGCCQGLDVIDSAPTTFTSSRFLHLNLSFNFANLSMSLYPHIRVFAMRTWHRMS